MTEVKHTPGPWFVTGSMTKYVEARIPGGLIQEVASCGPTEADGGYGDQQQANAKLIAAAPDLLAKLEETHAALCFTSGYIGSERHKRNAAAIAKATQ